MPDALTCVQVASTGSQLRWASLGIAVAFTLRVPRFHPVIASPLLKSGTYAFANPIYVAGTVRFPIHFVSNQFPDWSDYLFIRYGMGDALACAQVVSERSRLRRASLRIPVSFDLG